MLSTFSWLDYSDHERRRMLEFVKYFGEQETRDELGIGSIRDALADLLFPGTGTVQTRARYFFFVPWIYLALERRANQASKIVESARQQETQLIYALLASGETNGVIGREAKERLQRLPSNIYWQGLGVLGFRMFAGSQDQYHRSFARLQARAAQVRRQREEDGIYMRVDSSWHPSLPPAPKGFPNGAKFSLTRTEATYFVDRIQTHAPDSLLAFWASRRALAPQSAFPWEVLDEGHPAHLREQLANAQNFSEIMHGAALLYNLLLAEHMPSEDLVEKYRTELGEWETRIAARSADLARWDRRRFWEIVFQKNPRVPRFTRIFVEEWLDVALPLAHISQIMLDTGARNLIRSRESYLKRGQARLENRRALDQWTGAAGTAQLAFRWRVAQSHLEDIHAGLQSEGGE